MRTEWIVTAEDVGEKLVSFLKRGLQQKCSLEFSLKRLKSFIDAGYCRLNARKERFHHTRLCSQDHVELVIPEIVQNNTGTLLPTVVFEDDDIVIYNKTAGSVCNEKLEKLLRALLVHRLDKETTGLLVCAKNEKTRDYFFEQFRKRQVKKEYIALVHGSMKKDHGSIKNYLAPIQKFQGTTVYGVTDDENGAVFAHTDWECIQRGEKVTFVRLFPHTGRTHQLRVHLCSLGHPIVGDALYGKEEMDMVASRQLLHAEKLSFFHPITKKRVEVIAPMPDDFSRALQKTMKGCTSVSL